MHQLSAFIAAMLLWLDENGPLVHSFDLQDGTY
jgi:hypothetical protein